MGTPENREREEGSRLYGVDIRALPLRFRGETGKTEVLRTAEKPALREILQKLGNRPEIHVETHALNMAPRVRFSAADGYGNKRPRAFGLPFLKAGLAEDTAMTALWALVGAGIVVFAFAILKAIWWAAL